ncbi:MAG: helix-turn-helix domain-containing protein [Fibrobacterales bacterium]
MDDKIDTTELETNSKNDSNEKLGQFLRKKRTGLKIELAELSRESKINMDYLNSIEGDRFDELPGEAYTRAYLKTLAKKYNIDTDSILNRYAQLIGAPIKQAITPASIKATENSRVEVHSSPDGSNGSGKQILVIVIIIMTLGIVIYNFTKESRVNGDPALLPFIAQESTTSALDSNASSNATDSLTADSTQSTITEPTTAPSATQTTRKDNESTARAPVTVPEKVIEAAQEPVTAKPTKPVYTRISFSVTKDSSWAAVRTPQGKTWAKTIRPNSTRNVTRVDTSFIEIGEIKYLIMKLNGKAVPINRKMFQPLNGHRQIKIYNGAVVE